MSEIFDMLGKMRNPLSVKFMVWMLLTRSLTHLISTSVCLVYILFTNNRCFTQFWLKIFWSIFTTRSNTGSTSCDKRVRQSAVQYSTAYKEWFRNIGRLVPQWNGRYIQVDYLILYLLMYGVRWFGYTADALLLFLSYETHFISLQ